MARPSSVWADRSKGTYRSTIDGVRVTLCKIAEGKRKASAVLARMLAEREDRRSAGPAAPLVGAVITFYLRDLIRRREAGEIEAQTKPDFERRTAGFVAMHGDLPVDQVKPHHVDEWLASKADWGKTSRHDGVGAVKSAFNWAVRKGHLDRNPLSSVEKPKRAPRREVIPTPESVAAALAAEMTDELRLLIVFIHATGCRPKEARTVEARHLDRPNRIAALPRHKTSGTTDKKRVLYLAGPSAGIAFRLADRHPEGPIFRNTKGNPWTKGALVQAMGHVRRRAGLGKEVVAYSLRHAYATDALARKVSAALVAELMGHADLRMLATYSHVSERHDALREAAEQVRGETPGPVTPP